MRAEAEPCNFSVRVERDSGVESSVGEFAGELYNFQALHPDGLRISDGFEWAFLLNQAGPAFRELALGKGGGHSIVIESFDFRKFAGNELVNDFLCGCGGGSRVVGLIRRRL